MVIREISDKEKEKFNAFANHPLQSWQWGQFREKTGLKVIRLGVFEKEKLQNSYQVTIHSLPIPKLNLKIIYFPKGPMPDKNMLRALKELGQKEKAVYVKLEPNIGSPLKKQKQQKFTEIKNFLIQNGCQPGRSHFTPYTFKIDLTQTEEELLSAMKEKTRYYLRLSQKHGVEIVKDNSPKAFKNYLKLMQETTQRQGFYAHTPEYHQKMWETLRPAKIAHLFLAKYKERVLATWMLFVFKDTLYYPYGASSRENREVMPAYGLMWAAIKFGQKMGLKTFDLWGSLGPKPDPKDPWFGFHRFKKSFGSDLIKFIGTYDLIINPPLYPFVRLADNLRQKYLRLKTSLPF